MFVIPRTKHIASRIFDFPEPLRPVIALKEGSQPTICVRTGYDLKPSSTSSSIRIVEGGNVRLPRLPQAVQRVALSHRRVIAALSRRVSQEQECHNISRVICEPRLASRQ